MSGAWRPLACTAATLVAAGGLVMLAAGAGPSLLIVAVLMIVGLLVERSYRSPGDAPPGEGWRATKERFTDPETGKPTRVWYHQASGERRYVAEDPR